MLQKNKLFALIFCLLLSVVIVSDKVLAIEGTPYLTISLLNQD